MVALSRPPKQEDTRRSITRFIDLGLELALCRVCALRGTGAPTIQSALSLLVVLFFLPLFFSFFLVRGENGETDQTRVELEGVLNDGYVNHMRYRLPDDLTCDHCILMMRYRK